MLSHSISPSVCSFIYSMIFLTFLFLSHFSRLWQGHQRGELRGPQLAWVLLQLQEVLPVPGQQALRAARRGHLLPWLRQEAVNRVIQQYTVIQQHQVLLHPPLNWIHLQTFALLHLMGCKLHQWQRRGRDPFPFSFEWQMISLPAYRVNQRWNLLGVALRDPRVEDLAWELILVMCNIMFLF